MKITTTTVLAATREDVWPLLTGSTMNLPGCFCLGVPRPIACELPGGTGGVGAERRCISDRGTVVQRITVWEPPARLRFEMRSTDHTWAAMVDSLEDEFTLHDAATGTRVTRTTHLVANSPLRLVREFGFALGIKRVHFHVFKNWRASAAMTRSQSRPGRTRITPGSKAPAKEG